MTDQIAEQLMLLPDALPDHHLHVARYKAAGLTQTESMTLETRAARIITFGRRAILEIGAELLEARQEARHGTWALFLDRCGLEERTARNYMNVTQRFGDKSEIISDLPLTALYALSAPGADPVVVGEILAEVEMGEAPTITAIKERLAPPPPTQPVTQVAPRPAVAQQPGAVPVAAQKPAVPAPAPTRPTLLPAASPAPAQRLPPALPVASVDTQREQIEAQVARLLAQEILAQTDANAGTYEYLDVCFAGDQVRNAAQLFLHAASWRAAVSMLSLSVVTAVPVLEGEPV